MGDVNHDAAYIIKIADAAQAVGDTPPASLHLGVDVKKILDGLPQRGYYPATSKKPPPPFDYNRNILFQAVGKAQDNINSEVAALASPADPASHHQACNPFCCP